MIQHLSGEDNATLASKIGELIEQANTAVTKGDVPQLNPLREDMTVEERVAHMEDTLKEILNILGDQ